MVNWLGIAAVVLGFGGYGVGLVIARRLKLRGAVISFILVSLALALPAFIYALYYSKLLGEPIWLYRVRTIPGSELLASPAGLLAGYAQIRVTPRLRLSAIGKRSLVPVVLGFTLLLPYLKPWLRPLRAAQLQETWKGKVCLQSTPSTCGPAAAATIVRHLGGNLSEVELARSAFTSRSGTENWYLARALRQRGFATTFLLSTPSNAPLPALAGVRVRSAGHSGHFIALLQRSGDVLTVADPMDGLTTHSLRALQDSYEFTGFFMRIDRSPSNGTR